MLTIQNKERLHYNQLDKKNFYVERISEIFDVDTTTGILSNHRYKIELTNRKYAINVFLDRVPVVNEQTYYRLYATIGIPIWLTIGEIKNRDKFLDKIRLVGIN